MDLPRENRQHPVLWLVSKHLSYISTEAERKAAFVGAVGKDGSPEGLWEEGHNTPSVRAGPFPKTMQELLRPTETYSRSVLSHEPQVVAEQRADADEEEGGHDEEEQDVELGVRVGELFL